jgi:predicted transcriptional regulator
MIDIAANYFVTPQTVSRIEQGEPDYFDIIGETGSKVRQKIKEPLRDDMVTIRKDNEVEIEVQSGMGFTDEGKKGRMQEIMDYMVQMSQAGLVDPTALKEAMKKMLEIYQFGPTEEMMEALDQPTPVMDETMMQQMKVAVAEVLKDIGYTPSPTEDERILQTKVGVAEAVKDLGGQV